MRRRPPSDRASVIMHLCGDAACCEPSAAPRARPTRSDPGVDLDSCCGVAAGRTGSGLAGTACVGTLAPPRACCFSPQALSLAGGGLAVRARRAAACCHAPATRRVRSPPAGENLPFLCVT